MSTKQSTIRLVLSAVLLTLVVFLTSSNLSMQSVEASRPTTNSALIDTYALQEATPEPPSVPEDELATEELVSTTMPTLTEPPSLIDESLPTNVPSLIATATPFELPTALPFPTLSVDVQMFDSTLSSPFNPELDTFRAILERETISAFGERETFEIDPGQIRLADNSAFGGILAYIHPDYPDASGKIVLFVAQQIDGIWQITFENEPNFVSTLYLLPDELVNNETRSFYVEREQSQTNITAQGNGDAGLSLPWAIGETWSFTGGSHNDLSTCIVNGVRDWNACATQRPWSSLDFSSWNGNVRAMGPGFVYTWNNDQACKEIVQINHRNGYETIYRHVVNAPGFWNSNVNRYDFVGNVSQSCYNHVHVSVWFNGAQTAIAGMDIGGWTVSDASYQYDGCLARARGGPTRCADAGGNSTIQNEGLIGSGFPGLPTITSPTNGHTITSASFTLQLQPGVLNYTNNYNFQYQIASDQNFTAQSIVLNSGWQANGQTSFAVTGLSSGTYYVRASQGDTIGLESGWTNAIQFVVSLGPQSPTIISPVNNSVVTDYQPGGDIGVVGQLTVQLTGNAGGGYHLELANGLNQTFATAYPMDYIDWSMANNITIRLPQSVDGYYRLRAQTRTTGGTVSGYSSVIQFQLGVATPTITTQPQSWVINSGQTVSLTVVSSGASPLNYQWYRGASGDTSNPVGTNSTSFTTPILTTTTAYWVRVSNSLGYMNSNTATVTMNSAPTLSNIADQTTSFNTATSAIAFTVGDSQTAVGSLTLSGSSSNTTIVPTANIVFGGSGANRTVTITPATGQSGPTTITVTVSDGALSASKTFLLTVSCLTSSVANDCFENATAVSTLPYQVTQSVYGATKRDDSDPPQSCNGNGDPYNFTQSVWFRYTPSVGGTVRLLTNNYDSVMSVYTGTKGSLTEVACNDDIDNPAGILTSRIDMPMNAGTTYHVMVTRWGDPPTTLFDLPFSITQLTVDNTPPSITSQPASQTINSGQAVTLSVVATGTAPLTYYWYRGTAPDTTNPVGTNSASFTTPALTSTTSYWVRVSNTAGPVNSNTATITIQNSAPTISDIGNQTTTVGMGVGPLAFTIGDAQTTVSSLTLTWTSSNTTLVPLANIVFGGSGANRTATVTPASGQSGSVTITVTVTDGGGLSASDSFTLLVMAPGSGSFGMGLYNPANAVWMLRDSLTNGEPNRIVVYGGISGGLSVVGDWNGDGIDTLGMYVPSLAYWFLRNSNTAGTGDIFLVYGGISGALPVVGDWNGDGIDTVGLYNPTTGMWYLRNSNTSGQADVTFLYGGIAGALPVAGDWNGDGVDTVGLYVPTTALWLLRNSNTGGDADVALVYGGISGAVPLVGDWDNNGTDTVGMYVPNLAYWFLRNSNTTGTGQIFLVYGGISGAPPIVGRWS